MFSGLRRIWRAAPLATIILAGALTVALFFAVRMTADAIYWNDPKRQELAIEPWMTPRYIAHSWHVPPRMIAEALGAPMPPPDGPMTIRELAAYLDVPEQQLVDLANQAIRDFRQQNGSPPTGTEKP